MKSTPLLVLSVLVQLATSHAGEPQAADLPQKARDQIQALQAEKSARTPAQRKLDSQLVHAAKAAKGDTAASGLPSLRPSLAIAVGGMIHVEIDATVGPALLDRIKTLGGRVTNSLPVYHFIAAEMPLTSLETLAERPDVRSIRPIRTPITNTGSVTSQGDITHAAAAARSRFGANGTGIKVGVMSDSIHYLAQSQASEDLPDVVTVLPGQGFGAPGYPIGIGEGTALMEIVHDIAPGAQLYFATGFTSAAQFAQNIRDLHAQGCDIILDDVGRPEDSPFQDEVIQTAIREVCALGVLYFASAPNSGNLNDGTSGTWEGDFVNGGSLPGVSGEAHNWGSSIYNQVTGGSSLQLNLFWSDPLGASNNDYDLFVVNASGTVVAISDNVQNGSQDPYESIGTLNIGDRVVVVKKSGVARFLHLDSGRGRLNTSTAGCARGHQAATAPNAFCIAATNVNNSFPNAFSGGATNPVRTFSSDGPRRIFFNPDGSPITPGNFSSSGGRVVQKPDFAAADNNVTSAIFNGTPLNPLGGTSSSVAHAGALAALVKSHVPDATPGQIRAAFESTALDIEAPGIDRDSGHGIMMPELALEQLVSTLPPVVTLTSPLDGALVSTLTAISGTAVDPNGLSLVDDRVYFTYYSVSRGEYWTGSSWTTTQTTVFATVDGSGNWTYSNLPEGPDFRTGQFAISAYTTNSQGRVSQPVAGVSNAIFRIDNELPDVAITVPGNNATIDTKTYVFQGTADDDFGIDRVVLFIHRKSDGKYWNGSGWITEALSANLPSNYNSGTWASASPLPQAGNNPVSQLVNGSYDFIAIAIDNAGNEQQAVAEVTVAFHEAYTWTGATLRDSDPDNNSNSWGNPSNWSPYGVPGVEDVAIIGLGDRVDSTVSRTVHGLQLSAGTINFTSGPGPHGTLTTTNATAWTGGTLTGIWENHGTAVLSGLAEKVLGDYAVINNFGTMVWDGGGLLQAWSEYGNSTVNNKSGGIFRIATDGTVFGRQYTSYRPVFNNESDAVLEKQGGDGSSTLTVWEYRNAGEIRCGTGTLAFVDGGFDNYDLFLDPGTTLTGAGTLRVNNATQLNTAVNAVCTVELMEDSQIAAPAAANVARFEGILNWWGGVIVGNLTIGPDGVVNLSDAEPGSPKSKVLWDSTTLNNEGTINWLGGGALQSRAEYGPATVNNLSGGVFNLMADGIPFGWVYTSYVPIFNNEAGAVFRKAAGSGTSLVNTFTFNHRGGMVCDTGMLAFSTTLGISSATPWTGAGDFEMQGGTTTVSGTMSLNGPTFTILDGSVYGAEDGSGAFATAGGSTVEWQGGTFLRTLRVAAGGSLNLSGPAAKTLSDGAVLNNDGTIVWQGGGTLRAQAEYGTATVNNRSGGEFHAAADGTVFDRAYTSYIPVFNNAAGAKFLRTAGSGTATIHTYTFNNEGEIASNTGILTFNTTLNLKAGGTLGGAGLFEMAGGIANVTGTTSLTGTSFSVHAGTIAGGAGAVWASSAGGAWRWLGGNLSGTLEIGVGSNLQIADPPAGPSVKWFSDYCVLNNKGIVSWSGAGALRASAEYGISTVNNRSGGQFHVTADGVLLSRQFSSYVPEFNNEPGALFEKPTGDSGVASTCDWRFNNGGTVQIGGGKVEFLQGGDSSGTFNTDAGAFLRFCGGSHTLRNGTIFSGTGRIQVAGGTLLGDGVLNGNTTSPGAFELLTGTLGGATNYTGSGLFHWAGGTVAGTLTLESQTRCELDGDSAKILADYAVIHNFGTMVWDGGGLLQAWSEYGNSTVNNKSGGIFRIATDGTVFGRQYTNYRPVFNNENGAVLEKQGGDGSSTLTVWEYRNAGEIRCGTGTLAFVDGGFDNYDLFLDPGTTLTGAGTLRVNNATQLNTAVNAVCTVELMEDSQIAAPMAANVARFEGILNWWGGVIVGNLTIGPAGVVNLSDAEPGSPKSKVLWDSTTLNNEGTINWLGGGALQSRAEYGPATVNNLSGGAFNLMADGIPFGWVYTNYVPIFNNEVGAVLRKAAGSGTSLVNTFAFNHRGGMVCDTGMLAFSTTLGISSATPWTGAGDFEMQGGTTTVGGTMSLNGPTFTILDGSVYGAEDGSGAFATAGVSTVEWQGGTFLRTLRVAAGGSLNLSGPAAKTLSDGAVLNNDGTIVWQGGGTLRAQAEYGTATVNNRSGGEFHAAADGTVFDRAYSNYVPDFNNAGGFRIGASPGLCTMSDWDFIQSSTGALHIEVAGPLLTEFDRLNLTSRGITLGGSLNVTKLNGYDPDIDTTFEFLTSAGRTGSFDSISAPGFAVDYTAGGATLRAIAAGLSYDDWVLAANMTGPNSLPNSDFDGDGQTNFAEYVFNTDPKSGNASPESLSIETIDGQKWLTLGYRRWEDREAAGVIYTPEGSPGLEIWDGIGVIDEDDSGAAVIAGSVARRCRVPLGGVKKFLHIKGQN